jgi:hypothetical protein
MTSETPTGAVALTPTGAVAPALSLNGEGERRKR